MAASGQSTTPAVLLYISNYGLTHEALENYLLGQFPGETVRVEVSIPELDIRFGVDLGDIQVVAMHCQLRLPCTGPQTTQGDNYLVQVPRALEFVSYNPAMWQKQAS